MFDERTGKDEVRDKVLSIRVAASARRSTQLLGAAMERPPPPLAIVLLEVGAFTAMAFVAVLWLLDPGGEYGAVITALGVLGGASELYRRYGWRFFKSERVWRPPSEMIRHREAMRALFKKEIYRCRHENLRKDVIIRDVKRLDSYPNVDESEKGISPWFKVGLLDTYHKGIKVGLGFEGFVDSPQGLRHTNYAGGEKTDVTLVLIGEIPFDDIEGMNVEGDEYYYLPHIYCHFSHGGEPYERLYYAEEVDSGDGIIFWREVISRAEVKKHDAIAPSVA